MVALSAVQASNASLATRLPAGMVAVFVGATSGIGEYAVKTFAQCTTRPKIYVVGRSRQAADRILAECRGLNPSGEYTFIQSDVSLLTNVDDVCQQILAKEPSINLLFQSQGSILMSKTSEGLPISYVLPVTSRILFALNLLPALQKATALRRVVSVFAGGFEGPFNEDDWAEHGVKKMMKARGHTASMITMAHNVMARQAPTVSFVHNYPGAVKSNFGNDLKGIMWDAAKVAYKVLGPVFIKHLPPAECGALQVYGATSARFPPAVGDAAGVPLSENIPVALGVDGRQGSGSYTINFDGENVTPNVHKHLQKAKADGAEEKLWAHIVGEIKRITGKTHKLPAEK